MLLKKIVLGEGREGEKEKCENQKDLQPERWEDNYLIGEEDRF